MARFKNLFFRGELVNGILNQRIQIMHLDVNLIWSQKQVGV